MPNERAWVTYIEQKFSVVLQRHECAVDLESLTATQSEIEEIKYTLVRYEAFRTGEPILVFKGRYGGYYCIDGHTRARVHWDIGDRSIVARLFSTSEAEVCTELSRVAAEAGGGQERRIWEVPIVDRLGKGSAAWEKYRQELLAGWEAEGGKGA